MYYLHGALHLFNDGFRVRKLVNEGQQNLRSQVENKIRENHYPLFVSEGISEQKLSRIHNNAYLSHCFNSLKSIEGSLFIFGHSLRDEDDYVFNLLNGESKVENIFVSLFGNVDSVDNKRIIAKVKDWEKEYHFYRAESANVWYDSSTKQYK